MLTALELANLVNKVNSLIDGKEYYVSKIYPILSDTYLFKLHHAFEEEILLMVSSLGVWRTRYILKSSKPSYFLASLNRLIRCKILSIKQFNNDRIIRIRFLDKMGDEDIVFYLVIELFSNSIFLCDSNMRIIATAKHSKRLKIGDRYRAPLDDRIDPMVIEREDLYPLLDVDDIEGWFAANVALPNSIVRLVLEDTGIRRCKNKEEVDRLYDLLIRIRDEIVEGKRSLIIDEPNYLEAIDKKFSSIILERLEKEGEEDKRREELLKEINAKERKKIELSRKAAEIRALADRFASDKVSNEEWKRVIALKIKDKGSVYSIASRLYDRAKALEKGIKKIDRSIEKSKEELSKVKVNKIKVKEKEDREWFERYRWFITSDSILAVGGRDASSNDILLKRYAKNDDLVFHADIHGSPFFILKDAKEQSIKEVAIATASFSRASWREGFNAIDVYYVKKQQLKASNKKGAFVVSGKKNYIKNVELKLGVGVIKYNNKRYLVTAPVDIFDKCVIIKPGDENVNKAAREIREKLMSIDKEFIESISMDDIIRILPSGGISIVGRLLRM